MTNVSIDNDGTWKGSIFNAQSVAKELIKRYGPEEVKNYDPLQNCFTFKKWMEKGYQVKKGEKSIRITTFIHKVTTNEKTGEKMVIQTYPKTVCLFYYLQVEKTKSN